MLDAGAMNRQCPKCTENSIKFFQLTACLFDARSIQCSSCKSVLVLLNPGVFLNLGVGLVTQILFLAGLVLAVSLSSWMVFVLTVLLMFALIVASMYFGKLKVGGIEAALRKRGT